MIFVRLKNLREDHDLSQNDIADYLNISQRTYSYYETGVRDIPIQILIKLADYYKTSIDYLVNRTNTKWLQKKHIEALNKYTKPSKK